MASANDVTPAPGARVAEPLAGDGTIYDNPLAQSIGLDSQIRADIGRQYSRLPQGEQLALEYMLEYNVGAPTSEISEIVSKFNNMPASDRFAGLLEVLKPLFKRIIDTAGYQPLLYPSASGSDSSLYEYASMHSYSTHSASAAAGATAARTRAQAADREIEAELPVVSRSPAAGATAARLAALAAEDTAGDGEPSSSKQQTSEHAVKILKEMLSTFDGNARFSEWRSGVLAAIAQARSEGALADGVIIHIVNKQIVGSRRQKVDQSTQPMSQITVEAYMDRLSSMFEPQYGTYNVLISRINQGNQKCSWVY